MKNKEKKVSEMSREELISEYKKLKINYDNTVLELNSLKRIVFGSRQEKVPKKEIIDINQCSLFDNEEEIEKDVQEQSEKQVEEITVHKKKKSKKRKAGLKRSQLKDVVIKRQEYVLNEEEKCPECNSEFKLIGKKILRTQIDFTPAIFNITEIVQNIYKCTECGTEESEKETPTFAKSETPKPLLAHSFASPSLASEVFYQKYYLGSPFYRQEKMWDDKGLVLPRNMMANWSIKVNEYYLEPLWRLMLNELKTNCKLCHMDETGIQVNKEPGRKANSKSYMWVLCSGEHEKAKGVIFKYSHSRSAKVAREILEGYKETLVTDGFVGYKDLPKITHSECWAHARRYFYESVPLLSNKKMDTSATGFIRDRIL